MIADYGLQNISSISGYIPPSELLPLYYRSSVLLVLTCQSTPKGAHGIMGTKFYEALGVEKPVLCVRSDEECLAEVIRDVRDRHPAIRFHLYSGNAEDVMDRPSLVSIAGHTGWTR